MAPDQRRVVPDLEHPSPIGLAELGHGLAAVAVAGPFADAQQVAPERLVTHILEIGLDIDAAVPHLQPGLLRQPGHGLAVPPSAATGDVRLVAVLELQLGGSQHQAAHQSLEVPLKRAPQVSSKSLRSHSRARSGEA